MNSNRSSTQIKAHYKTEVEVIKQILKLAKEFKNHYSLSTKEYQTQNGIVDRLYLLSQRYMMLVCSEQGVKYSEFFPSPAEATILVEYHEKLQMLNQSNRRLEQSLDDLRISHRTFESLSNRLDMTINSPFIRGDHFRKPASYFIEFFSDFFYYLHSSVLTLRYRSQQIDLIDPLPLEEYRASLEPSQDFEEYVNVGLSYVRCSPPIAY